MGNSMKWLMLVLLTVALLLSGYALYQTKRTEAAMKPQVRLIRVAAF